MEDTLSCYKSRLTFFWIIRNHKDIIKAVKEYHKITIYLNLMIDQKIIMMN